MNYLYYQSQQNEIEPTLLHATSPIHHQKQKRNVAGWGTSADPERTIFNRLSPTFLESASNTNVNVIKSGEHYFDISDFGALVQFHSTKLATENPLFVHSSDTLAVHASPHSSITTRLFLRTGILTPKKKNRQEKNYITYDIFPNLSSKKTPNVKTSGANSITKLIKPL